MLKTFDEHSIVRRVRAAVRFASSLTSLFSRLARRTLQPSPAHGTSEPLRAQDNQEGPPDLDEMWRDFNRRLNRLFGRKDGGGGGGATPGGSLGNGNGTRYGAGIALAVLALIWLGSGVFIVQEGQAGIVLQFGKYKYAAGSGIQWRLPYPFQSNEIVNMAQVRSIEIGRDTVIQATNLKDSSMLTADENIIDVRFAVQYRISDPAEFIFNNADPEANVKQAAETAVREIVGKNKMDYVLYEGREQVAIDLQKSVQRILDSYKTGILVTSVTLQSVQPPEQVQAAFDDAVKAGQDRERSKNEAQAYANDVIPRARGTAARMIEEARGYQARVVAQAEGDADRFTQVLTQYAKAPAVTRERMYLDTMQSIYQNSTKVLADGRGSNSLMYLPLDKLMERVKQKPAAGASTGTNTAPHSEDDNSGNAAAATPSAGDASRAAATDDPTRSRDFMRNRDSSSN
jgi:membrane protease subunit HflK